MLRPLTQEEIQISLNQLNHDWHEKNRKLVKEFAFDSFRQAIDFVNQVAGKADQANHHPDIFITYTQVRLTLSTHEINGLSELDFILAQDIETLRNH